MKLTLVERMALLNILPQQGNIITLRILMNLKEELSFTEEEIKSYGITSKTFPDGRNMIIWGNEFDSEEKDIDLGEVAHGVVTAELRKLDRKGLLREQALTLWEKFVENKQS